MGLEVPVGKFFYFKTSTVLSVSMTSFSNDGMVSVFLMKGKCCLVTIYHDVLNNVECGKWKVCGKPYLLVQKL